MLPPLQSNRFENFGGIPDMFDFLNAQIEPAYQGDKLVEISFVPRSNLAPAPLDTPLIADLDRPGPRFGHVTDHDWPAAPDDDEDDDESDDPEQDDD